MKRSFPRLASEAGARAGLLIVGALVLAAACSPNNSVKPGAPVLSKFTIVEGSTGTDITTDAADCPAGSAEGSDCVAADTMVEAGTIPMSPVCRRLAWEARLPSVSFARSRRRTNSSLSAAARAVRIFNLPALATSESTDMKCLSGVRW